MPAMIFLYLDDVDEAYRRALAAGATSLREPRDEPHGDRWAASSTRWASSGGWRPPSGRGNARS